MITKKPKGKSGRPIIRHGAYSYLTRLTVPDHRAYLRPYLTAVREGLIRDLGPSEEDLTTAQKLLVDRIVGQAGVIRLIEEYCREQGIFQGRFLQPVLAKNYGSFVNSLRLNLQALGINTRAGERILGPLEIAAEIDAENAREAAEKAAQAGEGPPQVAQDRLSPEDSPDTTDNKDDVQGEGIDNELAGDNPAGVKS